ncbi:hypothetical protein [Parapedobacter lycopersici]|uniref:hypothetical protein n=1 Tax=Parapedobacter lycopersici TaxID=1864939 RepID=UPI003342856C
MKNNNFLLGCAIGLIFPAIAYLLTTSSAIAWLNGKPLGYYGVAGLINLAFVRYGYRNNSEKTAQGIILVTFAAVLALLITQKITL